jgi:cobalt-zinc-cadmium efflux system membrane fusion protein
MKTISKILFIIMIISIFNACTQKQHNEETKVAATTETKHEEGEETVASLSPEQIQAVGIAYGNVEMKELTATISANGTLKVPNDKKASATSLFGGTISTINVQVGDRVSKGQIIATITNPQFVQLQEEYLTANSQITMAEQEYNRQKELFDNNAGVRRNLQNAEAELRTLRTKRASLQQQVQLMGINPSKLSNSNLKTGLVVTAPINGTVSNVIAQIGGYVDVSAPVAEIVDNSSLHLDLNIFERDLPALKVGQVIHFTLTNNPNNEYDAEIFSIGAAFENQSKTIPVHAKVKGKKTGLIDGMNITGIVSLNNVLTPAVPKDAVVNADGKYYIFIVADKQPAKHADEEHDEHINFEKIEVSIGISNMGYTAITPVTKLPKDAKVVTKGAFFINAKLSNSGGHDDH